MYINIFQVFKAQWYWRNYEYFGLFVFLLVTSWSLTIVAQMSTRIHHGGLERHDMRELAINCLVNILSSCNPLPNLSLSFNLTFKNYIWNVKAYVAILIPNEW